MQTIADLIPTGWVATAVVALLFGLIRAARGGLRTGESGGSGGAGPFHAGDGCDGGGD